MDTYETMREELAEDAQERAAVHYADAVRAAIRAVPDYAVTPMFVAKVAASFAEMAKKLPPSSRETARNYLLDLAVDMESFQ